MRKKQFKELMRKIEKHQEEVITHNINMLTKNDENFKKLHRNNKISYYLKVIIVLLVLYDSFINGNSSGIENLLSLLHLL